MQLLNQANAKLDAAERAHDVRTMRAALSDARRVIANVKARAEACGMSEHADPSIHQDERKSKERAP